MTKPNRPVWRECWWAGCIGRFLGTSNYCADHRAKLKPLAVPPLTPPEET